MITNFKDFFSKTKLHKHAKDFTQLNKYNFRPLMSDWRLKPAAANMESLFHCPLNKSKPKLSTVLSLLQSKRKQLALMELNCMAHTATCLPNFCRLAPTSVPINMAAALRTESVSLKRSIVLSGKFFKTWFVFNFQCLELKFRLQAVLLLALRSIR